jgi:hypothetical protein
MNMGVSSEGEEKILGEAMTEEEEVDSEEEKELNAEGGEFSIIFFFIFEITSLLLLEQESFTLLDGSGTKILSKHGTELSSSQDFYKHKNGKLI